jgi:hypothetical protein
MRLGGWKEVERLASPCRLKNIGHMITETDHTHVYPTLATLNTLLCLESHLLPTQAVSKHPTLVNLYPPTRGTLDISQSMMKACIHK